MTPRGQNNIKTGHGIPHALVNQKQSPLNQGVWEQISGGVRNAVNSVSSYFGGEEEKPKPKESQFNAKQSLNEYNTYIKPNLKMTASTGDKSGTITLNRGTGWTPGNKDLVEKLPAYKGDVNSIKKSQKSKIPEITNAISESVDYWQNPEVQKMYLKNHPEYKGDIKKAKQDINTLSANGSKYEFVKDWDDSKQNGKKQVLTGGAEALTFYPGYDRDYLREPGKPRIKEDRSQGNWFNNKSKNGIIVYNPNDKDLKSTAKHEWAHGSGFDAMQGQALGKVLGKPSSGDTEIDSYLSRPDEMYGNFTMLKSKLGLKPGEKINQKQYQQMMQKKNLNFENFSRGFKPENIVKAINTVAYNGDKKGLEKKNKIQSMGDSMNA